VLQNLFNKNPLLKILLPLLLICAAGLLFTQLLKPQLIYRQELAAKAAELNQEFGNINKAAAGLSAADKAQLEEQLQTMRDNLGLGLYSPELVQILEERARQTRIQIDSYSFAEAAVKDGLEERKLTLVVRGRYQAILDFQLSLEDFPPFTGAETIEIIPRGSTLAAGVQSQSGVSLPPGADLEELAEALEGPGRVGGQYNGMDLQAELTLSFSCVPETSAKLDSRDLPVREHPFR